MSADVIFISYRRGQDETWAGRLYDRCREHFGEDSVFLDTENIEVGGDFEESLDDHLQRCGAMILVIGHTWWERIEDLKNPKDWVRSEIAAALNRAQIPVIPVLINDAPMPTADDLPDDIKNLVKRQAIELQHKTFPDVFSGRLKRRLEKAIGVRRKPPWALGAAVLVGAGVALTAAFVFLADTDEGPAAPEPIVMAPDGQVWVGPDFESLASLSSLQPQQIFRECSGCPAMVVLPAGDFVMGSPENEIGRGDNEAPIRQVAVHSFGMGLTEVTLGQWQECESRGACMSDPRRNASDLDDDDPIVAVSWRDAQAYVKWLNSLVGSRAYWLPTEAEWEYAARAGTASVYSFGETISTDQANFTVDKGDFRELGMGEKLKEDIVGVDELNAENSWGLRHMHGNVWEWTEDCWHKDYSGAPVDGSKWGPANDGDCDEAMIRGGSYHFGPEELRSANRESINADDVEDDVGFRIVRKLTP